MRGKGTSTPRNGWGLLSAAPREALSSYGFSLAPALGPRWGGFAASLRPSAKSPAFRRQLLPVTPGGAETGAGAAAAGPKRRAEGARLPDANPTHGANRPRIAIAGGAGDEARCARRHCRRPAGAGGAGKPASRGGPTGPSRAAAQRSGTAGSGRGRRGGARTRPRRSSGQRGRACSRRSGWIVRDGSLGRIAGGSSADPGGMQHGGVAGRQADTTFEADAPDPANPDRRAAES